MVKAISADQSKNSSTSSGSQLKAKERLRIAGQKNGRESEPPKLPPQGSPPASDPITPSLPDRPPTPEQPPLRQQHQLAIDSLTRLQQRTSHELAQPDSYIQSRPITDSLSDSTLQVGLEESTPLLSDSALKRLVESRAQRSLPHVKFTQASLSPQPATEQDRPYLLLALSYVTSLTLQLLKERVSGLATSSDSSLTSWSPLEDPKT